MIKETIKEKIFINDLKKDTIFEKTAIAQYPGSPCAFRAVSGTLPMIKNSYALLIGPEICLYNAKLTMSKRGLTNEPLPNNLLFFLLSNDDIVFGISNRISIAIKDVCKKYNPEVLFVVTTCLQEIIGEDFDSLIEETSMEVNVPLLGIHTENFTCDSAAPGMENVSLELAKLMKKQKVEKKSINILGLRVSEPNDAELVKVLKDEGIKIKNIIPSYCLPSEIEKAPAAEFNLVLQQYSLPLAKEMENRFGTKYLYVEKPYTTDEIVKMYQKIASLLKIDIEEKIQKKKKKLDDKIKLLKKELNDKTCVLSMFQGIQIGRYFNLIELLLSLGMEVKGMIIQGILLDDWDDIVKLQEKGINIPIINSGNAIQNEIFLEELNPDFIIGSSDKEVMAKLGIEPRNLIPSFRKIGFEALEEILKILSKSPSGFEIIKYKEQYIKEWGKE